MTHDVLVQTMPRIIGAIIVKLTEVFETVTKDRKGERR